MKIAVIGGGAWGTTLANMLSGKGYEIRLWVREPELAAEIRAKRENARFLPGVRLERGLRIENDPGAAAKGADLYLLVVPCQYLRSMLKQLSGFMVHNPVIVCASKGIELVNLKMMSEVVQEELEHLDPKFGVLSGPSFAGEVSRGLPTAVSLGCARRETGNWLQDVLSTDSFRVYYNDDFRGVELGGALKNVMAIASGISDGLGFGTNTRAALITRGLAEMSRLGRSLGARERTFMGLSGLGDLVLTCTGDLSRNRQVGLRIGRGEKLEEIMAGMQMVAEGIKTTEAVYQLGRTCGVETPITDQVFAALFQDKDPGQAVRDLMLRELKEE
ncbi:MAG: NAD(P)-dependent glycerol-3-phosphate dehydrogenase [Desulfohalobiaceae bacterium]|nr:NAD(P)-dependent glycerol-3-phosphate dehydrogenase [Desulfohalobiaceae bacterium]